MATDSRWTLNYNHLGQTKHLFLDDAGYHKLLKVRATGAEIDLIFMFAGDAAVIDGWKKSINAIRSRQAHVPFEQLPVDGMNVAVASSSVTDLLYQFGVEFSVGDEANFAGSGSFAAAESWQSCQCARTAVESAKQQDAYTGGTVRYINLQTGEHNLVDDQIGLAELIAMFKQLAMVRALSSRLPTGEGNMNKISQTIDTSVKPANSEVMDAGEIAAEMASFDKSVAAGAMPKAPCDAYFQPWPEEDRKNFVGLMNNLFPATSAT